MDFVIFTRAFAMDLATLAQSLLLVTEQIQKSTSSLVGGLPHWKRAQA